MEGLSKPNIADTGNSTGMSSVGERARLARARVNLEIRRGGGRGHEFCIIRRRGKRRGKLQSIASEMRNHWNHTIGLSAEQETGVKGLTLITCFPVVLHSMVMAPTAPAQLRAERPRSDGCTIESFSSLRWATLTTTDRKQTLCGLKDLSVSRFLPLRLSPFLPSHLLYHVICSLYFLIWEKKTCTTALHQNRPLQVIVSAKWCRLCFSPLSSLLANLHRHHVGSKQFVKMAQLI